MKKIILKVVFTLTALYIIVCSLLYAFQDQIIFQAQKLDKNHSYHFNQNFEEFNIKTKDDKLLNGLLFKVDKSKGLIFYLHGNAGNLNSWGHVAKTYLDLNYDVFIFDYRGYGKSEGRISNQKQLFEDNQTAYDELKQLYKEEDIIILGYSIGSGMAAKLASTNHPKLLILQAPYYNLIDLMQNYLPIFPTFLLKYTFNSNEYLQQCKMPLVIFHGDKDEVIYYGSSLKLEKEFKDQDTLIKLVGQSHNGITENIDYKTALSKILAQY